MSKTQRAAPRPAGSPPTALRGKPLAGKNKGRRGPGGGGGHTRSCARELQSHAPHHPITTPPGGRQHLGSPRAQAQHAKTLTASTSTAELGSDLARIFTTTPPQVNECPMNKRPLPPPPDMRACARHHRTSYTARAESGEARKGEIRPQGRARRTMCEMAPLGTRGPSSFRFSRSIHKMSAVLLLQRRRGADQPERKCTRPQKPAREGFQSRDTNTACKCLERG